MKLKTSRFKLSIIFFLLSIWTLFNPKLGRKIMILYSQNLDTKLARNIDLLHK
jgi:hypothetical protein